MVFVGLMISICIGVTLASLLVLAVTLNLIGSKRFIRKVIKQQGNIEEVLKEMDD